ncbi:MAG: helix-turn-helix transcriptional regulator [Bacteroidota bacterium]
MIPVLLSEDFLKNVRTSAKILDAVSHRFRKRIIDTIEDYGALNVEALSGLLDASPAFINQHLDVLKKARVVDYQLDGKQFFYSINYYRMEKINQVIQGLADEDY